MNAADRKLLAQQTELSADFIVAALRKDRTKNVKIEWVKLSSGARCVEMSLEGVWWKPVADTLSRLFYGSRGSPIQIKSLDRVVRTKTEGYCAEVPYRLALPSQGPEAHIRFLVKGRGRPGTVIQFHP